MLLKSLLSVLIVICYTEQRVTLRKKLILPTCILTQDRDSKRPEDRSEKMYLQECQNEFNS